MKNLDERLEVMPEQLATLLFQGQRGSVNVHGVSVATVNEALMASYHVFLGDPFDSQKPVSRILVSFCLWQPSWARMQ